MAEIDFKHIFDKLNFNNQKKSQQKIQIIQIQNTRNQQDQSKSSLSLLDKKSLIPTVKKQASEIRLDKKDEMKININNRSRDILKQQMKTIDDYGFQKVEGHTNGQQRSLATISYPNNDNVNQQRSKNQSANPSLPQINSNKQLSIADNLTRKPYLDRTQLIRKSIENQSQSPHAIYNQQIKSSYSINASQQQVNSFTQQTIQSIIQNKQFTHNLFMKNQKKLQTNLTVQIEQLKQQIKQKEDEIEEVNKQKEKYITLQQKQNEQLQSEQLTIQEQPGFLTDKLVTLEGEVKESDGNFDQYLNDRSEINSSRIHDQNNPYRSNFQVFNQNLSLQQKRFKNSNQ